MKFYCPHCWWAGTGKEATIRADDAVRCPDCYWPVERDVLPLGLKVLLVLALVGGVAIGSVLAGFWMG